MTEIEKKAMEMKQSMEEARNEAAAAKKKAEDAEKKAQETAQRLEESAQALSKAEEKMREQETAIDNLDKSVKEQKSVIENLRRMLKENPKSFREAMRYALEEKKEEIQQKMQGIGSFTVELKIATTDITAQTGAQYTGTAMDPNIHAVPMLSNAFILAFGSRPLTGARLGWVESSTSKNVGYVKELAANSNKTTITFSEKYRKSAKIATYMEISSEFENWFENLYNFCIDEGQRLILKDADEKIWNGAGNDSSKQDEVYGIKTAATAFAKVGTYQSPTVADVLADAVAQIRKSGFAANVAIVSYGVEAQLKGLKDTTGNYIYDKVSQHLGQLRIIPSEHLTDTELLVADNSCAEVYFGSIYELEFTRQASTDSWRVDYRRHVQVKTTSPKKKGLVYVADISTAITSIAASDADTVKA